MQASSTPQCPPGSTLRGQDVAENWLGLLLVQCAILRMSILLDCRWLKAQDLLRVSDGHTRQYQMRDAYMHMSVACGFVEYASCVA